MNVNECIGVDGYGQEYDEVACVYKWFGAITSKHEMFYDHAPVRNWMRKSPHIPIIAVILYGAFIFFGTKMMKTRESWNLKKSLALWNLGLAVFSFIGFVREVPFIYHLITTRPFRSLFCQCVVLKDGAGSHGLWAFFFIISKFPELIDTFFVVVNKRKLLFLHWYHHMTVLLYCWYSYTVGSTGGGFYIVMNYAVHSIMYTYYFLMSIKMRPKWFNPKFITMVQILQMFIGVSINATNFYYFKFDTNADKPCSFNTAACFMYASYLVLFLSFFGNRYKVKSSYDSKKYV